jgi:hypothetical protein
MVAPVWVCHHRNGVGLVVLSDITRRVSSTFAITLDEGSLAVELFGGHLANFGASCILAPIAISSQENDRH